MLETKVMVAPNSPSAFAKQSTMPAISPGIASGKVTVRNIQRRSAPSVAAAASSLRAIASIASLIGRTSNGNPMTPQGSAAPGPREEKTKPERTGGKEPVGPRGADGNKK